MGVLLMVVGFGWALLGVVNVAMIFGRGDPSGSAFGLTANMVLFILPGLVCGAIGWHIGGKAATTADPVRFPGKDSR